MSQYMNAAAKDGSAPSSCHGKPSARTCASRQAARSWPWRPRWEGSDGSVTSRGPPVRGSLNLPRDGLRPAREGGQRQAGREARWLSERAQTGLIWGRGSRDISPWLREEGYYSHNGSMWMIQNVYKIIFTPMLKAISTTLNKNSSESQLLQRSTVTWLCLQMWGNILTLILPIRSKFINWGPLGGELRPGSWPRMWPPGTGRGLGDLVLFSSGGSGCFEGRCMLTLTGKEPHLLQRNQRWSWATLEPNSWRGAGLSLFLC